MRNATAFLSVYLIAATLAPPSAMADAPADEARQRMREGRELALQGRNEEARAKYAEACAVVHTFNCVRGLATAEFLSGHYVEAYDHVRETLADPSASQLDEPARANLDDIQRKAFRATGHIAVSARPGTTIVIDGRVIGIAPLAAAVTTAPGRHLVEVVSGDARLRADVDALAGETTQVEPVPPAGSPPPAVPSASGSALGLKPPPAPPSSSSPPVAETPPYTPRSFWTHRRTWGAVAAGGGAIAIGVGFAFAAAANHNADQADSLHNQVSSSGPAGCTMATASACSALQSAKDSSDRDRALNIGFVSAGLVGLAAGALLLFLPDASASAPAGVIPTVGPHAATLELRRSF